jgi:acetolactate synthase-1/2/3 large subunit
MRAHGVETMFTLSGGHIFPLYDAAVRGATTAGTVRLVDVRHEQSAVFAAEATARLGRVPGFAALTAGPGVTNAVSALTTAHFNGSPVVVVGGRSPDARWGAGALQELDHPALLAPVTKAAWTLHDPAQVGARLDAACRLAVTPHRGPVFVDVPIDVMFAQADTAPVVSPETVPAEPDGESLARAAELLGQSQRPVLVIGSDVWQAGAELLARELAEALDLPVVANGMGRGVLPGGHRLLVNRARGRAFRDADLVLVLGAPLDFRLNYGTFGDPTSPTPVIHLVDAADQVGSHAPLAAKVAGDLRLALAQLLALTRQRLGGVPRQEWTDKLRADVAAAAEGDVALLASQATPIHPARVVGEIMRRLEADGVMVVDGGDSISFAGRFIEPRRPGCWLDSGPYGCLGTGVGYAIGARIARPESQVVLLLGDGAAGFSLMDVDTLVRHALPVVIVVANNSCWAMEKHPMRQLYGYDVLADLRSGTSYDGVARALGGAGETVTRPDEIGAALDRAFASGVPYLVNVMTDPEVAYPRSTTGV